MALVHALGYYIIWHYTVAWGDMTRIVGNYLWFVQNFFSMGLLSSTLFAPWRRLSVAGGGAGESYVGAFLINTLMRGVGFLIRTLTILIGAAALFGVIVLAAAAALVWLVLPVVAFFLFFAGVGYFI